MALSEVVVGLLIGIVLFFLYLSYKYGYVQYQFLKRYGIKGPAPTPFLGNYKGRVSMNAMDFDKLLIDEYGSVCGYYIGHQSYIIVSDLDMLKQILVKDFDSFTDHALLPDIVSNEAEPMDLFSAKGSTWKTIRKTLSPTFSASKMKMMLPLIRKSADSLVEVMDEKAASGESFDVLKVYSAFALETILATAFGRRCEIQKGGSDKFSEAMSSFFSGFSDGQIERLIVFNSYFPWMLQLLRLIFSYTEAGKAMDSMKKVAVDLIRSRRESGHKEKYKDLLQLMIEATGEEEEEEEVERETASPAECPAHQETSTKPKKGIMTDSVVFANSVGFLIAGYETTSNTLCFTSYLLALHPDVQEKLQSEIDAYFDEKPASNLYTATQEITYLDQVIQESLRLYPSAVEIDRYCKKTMVINGVTIPKGAIVTVPIAYLHKSPKYWKDPEVFDPDRFTAEEKASRSPMCHIPFGFGPRSCIGMRLALLETKIALIELLKKYSFVKAPDTEIPIQFPVGIIVKPKSGVHLKVISRQ